MLAVRIPILVCLLAASSCYAALGVEHNFVVADELRQGMSHDECLDVLSHGGSVSIQRDLQLEPARDRAAALANPAAFATLERSERESGHSITRAVVINRHWGFAGFGVFYLLLDQRGQLVGYHLEHVN
jgi:hypothetical protein